MRDKALYFPYINIPTSRWIFRTVLYWDKLCSIVPIDYFETPDEMTHFMREMVVSELVEMVSPGMYLWSLPNFGEPFLEYINRKLNYRKNTFRTQVNNYSLVHIEKLGPIKDELIKIKIIIPHDGPWYLMPTWAAGAFMTYLACILGSLEEVNAAPITNDHVIIKVLSGKPLNCGMLRKRDYNVKFSFLEELFPIPSDRVTIDSIVRFKEKYSQLLPNLRNYIEKKTIEIASIKDKTYFNEALEIARRELREKIQEADDAIRSHWRHTAFTTINPIVSAASGIGAAVGIGMPYSGIISATSALATAIYNSLTCQDHSNYERLPLAYAAMWDRMIMK